MPAPTTVCAALAVYAWLLAAPLVRDRLPTGERVSQSYFPALLQARASRRPQPHAPEEIAHHSRPSARVSPAEYQQLVTSHAVFPGHQPVPHAPQEDNPARTGPTVQARDLPE